MPNWCSNTLTVEGPAKDIAAFKKKVRGRGPIYDVKKKDLGKYPVQVLSFHSTVPQPKFKKGDEGWYNWRVSRWGTKWEPSDPRIVEESKKKLVYGFDSAWSPPVEWVEATSVQFPKLTFRLWYAEGGCDFAGVFTCENGDGSTEDKDYVQAHVEEYGSYNACCEHCDGEVELTDAKDPRICSDCLEHLCANCDERDTAHIEGKCPFAPTQFKAIRDEEGLGQSP